MEAVQFALGEEGRLRVGDYCYFTSVVLLCDLEIEIGSYVIIDSDFHPLSPAQRIADAVACSPLGKGRPRPAVERAKVTIEDDVWIGPAATILKGVRIGAGSRIEAGSLITRSVPPGSRVAGNPARIIEQGGRA
jgi:acetyltransferase-like isoleucine patch superfamily enzyme